MSLINDALKKAQKQRTGDAPSLSAMPGVGGESAARIAKRDKPAGFNAQLVRLGLGAGSVLLVAVLVGYFVFRTKPGNGNLKPESLETDSGLRSQPSGLSSSPQVSALSPQVSLPAHEPATPPVTFTLPVAPPAAPVSSITASAGSEAIPTTAVAPAIPKPAPSATNTASPAGKQPAPLPSAQNPAASPATPKPGEGESVPVKLDSKSVTFIEGLRIAGIRASATDAKVLMNDRVYRVGDIVEHELGLKLTGITSSSLSFEDERGAKYTRSF